MKEHEIRVWAVSGRMEGLVLAAFALLVPLTMWLGFADGVEFPKHIVVSGFALLLALAVFMRAESRMALLAHPLAVPLTLLSLLALASTVLSRAPSVAWAGEDGSWKGSSTLISVWLGALCAGSLAHRALVRRWAVAVLVSAGLALAYGLFQAVGLDPVPWDPGRRIAYWVMATLGNPVHLGNYLVAAFFISLIYLSIRSVPAWIFRGLILVGILATLSRSALLSLLAGLIVWFSMRRPSAPRAGILAMASAPLAALPFLDQLGRLFSLTRLTGARPQIWEGAARMTAHHPLLGVGPDLFYSVFPAFAGYGFYSAEPPAVFGDTVFLRLPASAHSELLDTVSMLGLPALGLYIWALAVIARRCRNSPLLPAMAALWIGLQLNPSSMATSALFWTMAAVASRSATASGNPVRRGIIFSGITVAVILATLMPSIHLAEAQAYRRESGRLLFIGDRAGSLALQERWGKKAAHIHPRQAFDDAALLSSEPVRARGLLALAMSRNSSNLFYVSASAELDFNEGRRLHNRIMLADSEAGFRRALKLAPSALSIHDDLARVLDAQGRKKEAEAERQLRKIGDPRGLFSTMRAAGAAGK